MLFWIALCVSQPWFSAPRVLADGEGDGFYHRWDRDSSMSVAVGSVLNADGPVGAYVKVGWLLLDAAGVSSSFSHWPGQGSRLEVSVELQPLFPAFPLQGLATDRAWWDLWLQSLSLECGVGWSLGAGQGARVLIVGVGFEIPVVLPRPSGWRAGLRVATRRRFSEGGGGGPSDDGWEFRLAFAAHFGVNSGVGAREP